MTDSEVSALRPMLLQPRDPWVAPLPARNNALQLGVMVAIPIVLVAALTLSASIRGGSAGWYATAATAGDLPPPPGNAVWWLLARVVEALLPFSTAAGRVGLLSVLITAACGMLLLLWQRQWDIGRRAAITSSLLLAFGAQVWELSTLPHPAMLMLLLPLALFVSLQQWSATLLPRWFVLFGFVCGLCWSECPRLLLPWVALALFHAALSRRLPPRSQRGVWGTALAATAVGMIPGLVACALATSTRAWGEDTTLLLALSRHSSAAPLATSEINDALSTSWLATLTWQNDMALASAAAIGIVLFTRRHRWDACFLIVMLGTDVLTRSGSGLPLSMSYALLALFAGVSIDSVLQRWGNGPQLRPRALTAMMALLPLLPLVQHYPQCNYSEASRLEQSAEQVLLQLPRSAILFTGSHPLAAPLRYVQRALDQRPDVAMVSGGAVPNTSAAAARVGYDPGTLPPPLKEYSTVPLRAELFSKSARPVLSLDPTPLPGARHWIPHSLAYMALPDATIVPTDNRAQQQRLQAFPFARDPIPTRSQLSRVGDPLDTTLQRVAAHYYAFLSFAQSHAHPNDPNPARKLALQLGWEDPPH